MKRSIISALLLLVIFSLQAQRIISREKYSIVIASDTVYAGEMYTLDINLRNFESAHVKKDGMSVPIDATNKACVKFKASKGNYDWQGNSYQSMNLSIKIDEKVFVEKVTYVVKRLPIKEQTMQDSVSSFLSDNSAYKKIPPFDNVFIYEDFIKYLENSLPLHVHDGQASLALIINSQGKVIRYDFIKNSYAGISKEAFDKAILAYRVRPDMMSKSSFKFGVEVFTFKGNLENMFYSHGFCTKEVFVKH